MRILTIALAAAVGACSSDGTSPPPVLSGTYTLQTVDGQALPYRHRVETGREHYVAGGSISFSGQNTASFTQLWREREVAPNPERWLDAYTGMVVTLTYTRNGNDLTIETSSIVVPSAGIGLSVSGDGASVTLQFPIDDTHYDGNHRFVFRRD